MSAVLATKPPRKPVPAKPASPTLRRFASGSDWWDALGNVPLDRIVFDPPPGTVSFEDYARMNGRHEGCPVELVANTLVRKPMGLREGLIEGKLFGFLSVFLHGVKLGLLSTASGMMRMLGGNVRQPDISFFAEGTLDAFDLDAEAAPILCPALAIEVLSPSNTAAEIQIKIGEYFAGGTRLVWVLHPDPRLVDVYASPTAVTTLRAGDTLDGGDVLPGFAVKVSELFDV